MPKKVVGPFEALVVGSDDKKCIAVNMQDKSLTVTELEDTQTSAISFVISPENIKKTIPLAFITSRSQLNKREKKIATQIYFLK